MEIMLNICKDLIQKWHPDPTNVLMLKIFTSLATRLLALNHTNWNPPDRNLSEVKYEYDYIVIGGGTAGLVLASLLANANMNSRTLVIEGGPNAPLTTEIPFYLSGIQNSKYDWNYRTLPQNRSCQSFDDNTCHIPLGKMIGGSTLLRSMVYNTGTKRDWNRWENLGNPNWNWKTVLPYFKNYVEKYPLEHFVAFMGTCSDKLKLLRESITAAGKELGLGPILDKFETLTGKIGYGLSYGTLEQGKTNYPAKTFLRKVIKNGNIHILKKNIATKIQIDPKTLKARGVEFASSENEFNIRDVKAVKDIILCAGAINNAKLLMLSGVGSKEFLDSNDVVMVHRLEGVGRNLHDHVKFPIFHVIKKPKWDINFDDMEAIHQFLFQKEGPLTSIGISDIVGYIYSLPGERSDYPNIQINHDYIHRNSSKFFTQYNFSKPIQDYLREINVNYSILVQIPTLLKPKSRGWVNLKDADPFMEPLIDPNYLNHNDDIIALIRAAKHAVAMGETKAFRKIGAELINFDKILCMHCDSSKCKWECLLKQFATSGGNPVGTTRMGKCPECSNSVVDHCLRVHGIRHLRVADASIMPEIIGGDIYASNIMIAQRAAEFILNKDACT